MNARVRDLAVLLALTAAVACTAGSSASTSMNGVAPASASLAASLGTTDSAAGSYLAVVGGCNDCHTVGWAERDGNVPEAERLTGSPVGYRGPWGTTYAVNLRLLTQRAPESTWVNILRTAANGHGRPPMPFMNTRQMRDGDLRAMYRYIRALGPRGERTPRAVPPGQEPTTPYILMVPQTGK